MSPARITRATAVMLGALILLVAGGAVVAYQIREPRDADAALDRAGNSIQTQIQWFHRQGFGYPNELRLRPGAIQLVGTSTTETNTLDLDSGVRLAWYADKPDPRLSTTSQERGGGYSFCLSLHGRRWRLNATNDGVTTGGPPKGACPRPPAS